MAEVISVLRYLFTAAAGAVTALGSLYLYTSVYSAQPPPRLRPLRVLITAAGGGCRRCMHAMWLLCMPVWRQGRERPN